MTKLSLVILFLLAMASCEEVYQPLPVGQLRIALPTHEYSDASSACPYTLEAPVYSHIKMRTAPDGNCWSDVVMPDLKAVIHLSYRELHGDLGRTLQEAHELTYGHVSMADNITDETVLYPAQDVYGTVYTISGNVASNIQFYLTDSVDHFLRGALYFDTAPNKDSLAPVVEHIRADIDHMIESIRWKE